MYEVDFIKNIVGNFTRSPHQENELFTSDCEVVTIGDTIWGFSVDDFSAEEDYFGPVASKDIDHFALGQNLAIASLSDILVCGCTPKFYMQTIVVPRDNPAFAQGISEGIKDILEKCETYLIGGDIGSDLHWRYNGIGIGLFENTKPVMRILPNKPQSIWVTGSLGGINLNAYSITSGLGLPTNNLNLRLEESSVIKKHGLAAIDTSGGFMDSIWTLSYLNPSFIFSINPEHVPYHSSVMRFCQEQKIPPEAFLIGGAGEYEFVFTTDEDIEIPHATKIGTAIPADTLIEGFDNNNPPPTSMKKEPLIDRTFSDNSGIKWGDRMLDIPPPSPREFKSREEYTHKILEYVVQRMS